MSHQDHTPGLGQAALAGALAALTLAGWPLSARAVSTDMAAAAPAAVADSSSGLQCTPQRVPWLRAR